MAAGIFQILFLAFLGKSLWGQTSDNAHLSISRLSSANTDKFDGQVRVLTWNILAPCYVKSPPPSWVDDRSLKKWSKYTDWSYRQEKIVNVIAASGADIVCLQEVQISLCSDLGERLSDAGFHMHVQDTKGHPVANVILVSKKLNWDVVFEESRSRAMILALQPRGENYPPIFIVNVHLQATRRSHTENAQTRFSQMKSLMKRVDLAWTRIYEKLCPDDGIGCDWSSADEPSVLIMGDFNLSPTEPLYTLMSKGQWPENCKEFLPAKVSELTASKLPFLPLRDARGEYSTSGEYSTILKPWTYAGTKQIFDYIFVSGQVETVLNHNYVPSILVDEKKVGPKAATIEPKNNNKPRILWPNEHHPSDHIPIGATLQIQQKT